MFYPQWAVKIIKRGMSFDIFLYFISSTRSNILAALKRKKKSNKSWKEIIKVR